MLTELRVENFGLMEKVILNLENGFSVFTGETGAGKSMLIDALSVLLGGRATADLIRHGKEKARIEAIFEALPAEVLEHLQEEGYPADEGQLILYRELNASGRNICRVQGRTVPLTLYRSLCEGLVDIHGQMEHQSLLNPETHRYLLDAFGGNEQLSLLSQVNGIAKQYKSILRQESDLMLSEEERQRREDMLRYQIEEIAMIDPKPGEEEQLLQEKRLLSNSERITTLTDDLYNYLYKGFQGGLSIYDLLGSCRKALSDLLRFDPESSSFADQVEAIYYSVEDLAEQIRSYRENLDFQPGRLEEIEERLVQLHRLRKYSSSLDEVFRVREEINQELQRISNTQAQFETLKAKEDLLLKSYNDLAQTLSRKRLEQAANIEKGVHNELKDLGLEHAIIKVHFTPVGEPAIGGAENVEFYFSANPGEPSKPLAKVASGGEMSRLMLAFKSLLSRAESVGTFIFDEVDSGVGGRTIQKVGEKLAKIAKYKQVFCITHAAHVAAFADDHFGIRKDILDDHTRTEVNKLTEEERIEELSRMLGGEDISYDHARKLRQNFAPASNS